jgi:hypothetical protein
MSRADQIKALAGTEASLRRLTASLPDEALDFHPAPGEWSIREILAHLVDDETFVMRTRLERIIKEDQPDLVPHDEKRWYATRNTTRDGLDELLADYALQRNASLGIMHFLRESDWQRQGFQPEYGHFTAEGWLDHWVAHDTNHLRQIEANWAAYEAQG